MPVVDMIKKLLSFVIPVKIHRGYGLSNDDAVLLNKAVTLDQLEEPLIKTGALYKLKPAVGRFEMVGFSGGGKDVRYQLKHVLSGETFNVSKNMMQLLFQKDHPHE